MERQIKSNAEVALLVVDMMTHEGKMARAKKILADTGHFSASQKLQAKLYIGQIHFNEQKVSEARKVAVDLLGNSEARESAGLMRGVLDILTLERPDDPPFYLDVKQMNEILGNLEEVMRKHSLECDFMRLIKRWGIPVWEQMNIDNLKHNKRQPLKESRFDGGNHLSLLLHPFILTFAKLEQVQSELFESQFTMLRKDILLNGDQDNSGTSLQVTDDAVASAIAHQTMFNQGYFLLLLTRMLSLFTSTISFLGGKSRRSEPNTATARENPRVPGTTRQRQEQRSRADRERPSPLRHVQAADSPARI